MPKKLGGSLLVPITSVSAVGRSYLVRVKWADGYEAEVDLKEPIRRFAVYAPLEDKDRFQRVVVSEDGWTIDFGDDLEMPTDHVRKLALEQAGEIMPVERFKAWRVRNRLSHAKAAKALGLGERTIAYYDKGERLIPKHIMLACIGYEATALRGRRRSALRTAKAVNHA